MQYEFVSQLLFNFAGPDSPEANEFRSFWGSHLCELRRFEDGSIHESISLHNPWGPAYLVPAILRHLLNVHHEHETDMELLHFNHEQLPMSCQSHEDVKLIRGVMDSLSKVLISLADPSLPIRRVRGLASCLNHGGEIHLYRVPEQVGAKLVERKGPVFLLKKDASIAPSLTRSIPVMLDITHKKHLNMEMFNYLRVAYLVNLKKKLEERGVKCMIKDLKLYLQHQKYIFSLDVDPPANDLDSEQSIQVQSVSNLLQTTGLRHLPWAGTCHLVKRWLSGKMLDSVISEQTLLLLLANVFINPVPNLDAPLSVESAMLRFFDFLSFHDFEYRAMFLNEDGLMDSKSMMEVKKAMHENRSAFPAAVLITPFDRTPSSYTRDLSKADLKRLVNLARQTLHTILSGPEGILDLDSYESTLSCDPAIFDIIINLKPLQIPMIKERKRGATEGKPKNLPAFPIVDFNPVDNYLSELKECFRDAAKFYYGTGSSWIGVKLEKATIEQTPVSSFKHSAGKCIVKGQLVQNISAMVEDFKVIGQGMVKEVECNLDQL